MKRTLLAASTLLLWAGATGFAHRLDEYLQATLLSVEKERIGVHLRLTPGVAVFPAVLASIDSDADGVLSGAEQRAYAERVLRDLSLTMDGDPIRLQLVSAQFAGTGEMREGLGAIELDLRADLPQGGPERRLVFRNHHQPGMAAYLVNSLVPRDPAIRLAAQHRAPDQSEYELDYVENGASSHAWPVGRLSGGQLWTAAAALILAARLAWQWRAGAKPRPS